LRKRILFLIAFCGLAITTASAQTAQNFNRFNFNVGGGLGGALGDVGKFTGKSYHGVAGGGVNFSRRFGLKAEYMYYNLSFQDSVKLQQSVPDATGHLHSATLNAFLNFPLQGKLGVYAIGGAGWYQRTVEAQSQFLAEGTIYHPAWELWGITSNTGSPRVVSPSQTLSSNTVSAGGYNFGGGITYRLNKSTKIYAEGRYHHANTSGGRTAVFPVTVGLRW
jgi:opacity protein-like surface antigen